MVILVTGGAGYIGSKLIRDLAVNKKFQGSTVRIFDNMMRERYCSLWNLPDGVKYEFIEGDVRKKDDLKTAFKDVDIVFQLSDITNAPKSFENEELTKETNYHGVLNVFDGAAKNNVDKFVYASSASLYGPTKDVVTEEYDCKPISPYGKYKLMAETDIMKKSKEIGLNLTSLRQGTVHGWSIGMRFDTVINRFVYLAVCGGTLELWETAIKEKRPYLNVGDASRAFMFAVKNSQTKNQIFNVVSENAALMEVVENVKTNFPEVKTKITPTPNLNQVSYIISNKKLLDTGFEFKYKIGDGIKDMADKFSKFRK